MHKEKQKYMYVFIYVNISDGTYTHIFCFIKNEKFIHSMTLTKLEDLPNELFYIIFTYLNGVDLCLAFSNLNTRIHRLLDDVTSHQSLDLTSGSVSYNAFCAYIADQYGVRSSFISALKFNCLSLSPFGIEDLFSCFTNISLTNRLQRLTLTTNKYASVTSAHIVALLEHMMIANKQGRGQLQHLIFMFTFCDDYYAIILTNIIRRNITFDTMILNITRCMSDVKLYQEKNISRKS